MKEDKPKDTDIIKMNCKINGKTVNTVKEFKEQWKYRDKLYAK